MGWPEACSKIWTEFEKKCILLWAEFGLERVQNNLGWAWTMLWARLILPNWQAYLPRPYLQSQAQRKRVRMQHTSMNAWSWSQTYHCLHISEKYPQHSNSQVCEFTSRWKWLIYWDILILFYNIINSVLEVLLHQCYVNTYKMQLWACACFAQRTVHRSRKEIKWSVWSVF